MNRIFNLLILMMLVFPAGKGMANEITPYIETGIVNESNLFLLDNAEQATEVLGTRSRSDTLFEFSPGVRGRVDLSKQSISFDASDLRREYDRFDSLDFTGADARVN